MLKLNRVLAGTLVILMVWPQTVGPIYANQIEGAMPPSSGPVITAEQAVLETETPLQNQNSQANTMLGESPLTPASPELISDETQQKKDILNQIASGIAGSFVGQSKYHSHFDLDSNGEVGLMDLLMVASIPSLANSQKIDDRKKFQLITNHLLEAVRAQLGKREGKVDDFMNFFDVDRNHIINVRDYEVIQSALYVSNHSELEKYQSILLSFRKEFKGKFQQLRHSKSLSNSDEFEALFDFNGNGKIDRHDDRIFQRIWYLSEEKFHDYYQKLMSAISSCSQDPAAFTCFSSFDIDQNGTVNLEDAKEIRDVLALGRLEVPALEEPVKEQRMSSPYENPEVPANAIYWDFNEMKYDNNGRIEDVFYGFSKIEIYRKDALTWDDVYVWDDALQAKRPKTWEEIQTGETIEKDFQLIASMDYLSNRYIDYEIRTDSMMFSGYDYKIKIVRQDGSSWEYTPKSIQKVNYGDQELNPENVLIVASSYENPFDSSLNAKGYNSSLCPFNCLTDEQLALELQQMTKLSNENVQQLLLALQSYDLIENGNEIKKQVKGIVGNKDADLLNLLSQWVQMSISKEEINQEKLQDILTAELEDVSKTEVYHQQILSLVKDLVLARVEAREGLIQRIGNETTFQQVNEFYHSSLDLVAYYKERRNIPAENEVRIPVYNRLDLTYEQFLETVVQPIYSYLTSAKDSEGNYLIEKIKTVTFFPGTHARLKFPTSSGNLYAVPIPNILAAMIPKLARAEKIGEALYAGKAGHISGPWKDEGFPDDNEERFHYAVFNPYYDAGTTDDILRWSLGYTQMLGEKVVSGVVREDKINLKGIIDQSIQAEEQAKLNQELGLGPEHYAHIYDLGGRAHHQLIAPQPEWMDNSYLFSAKTLLEEYGYTTYADMNRSPIGLGRWYGRGNDSQVGDGGEPFTEIIYEDNPITDQELIADLSSGEKVLAGLSGGYWFWYKDFERVYAYLQSITSFAPGAYIAHWDETGNGRTGMSLDGVVTSYSQEMHGWYMEYPQMMGAMAYVGIPLGFGALLAPSISRRDIHIFGDPLFNPGKFIVDKVVEFVDEAGNFLKKTILEIGSFLKKSILRENGTDEGEVDYFGGDRSNEIYLIQEADSEKIKSVRVGIGTEEYHENGSMTFSTLNDLSQYEYDASGKIIHEKNRIWEVDENQVGHYVTYTRNLIYDQEGRYQGFQLSKEGRNEIVEYDILNSRISRDEQGQVIRKDFFLKPLFDQPNYLDRSELYLTSNSLPSEIIYYGKTSCEAKALESAPSNSCSADHRFYLNLTTERTAVQGIVVKNNDGDQLSSVRFILDENGVSQPLSNFYTNGMGEVIYPDGLKEIIPFENLRQLSELLKEGDVRYRNRLAKTELVVDVIEQRLRDLDLEGERYTFEILDSNQEGQNPGLIDPNTKWFFTVRVFNAAGELIDQVMIQKRLVGASITGRSEIMRVTTQQNQNGISIYEYDSTTFDLVSKKQYQFQAPPTLHPFFPQHHSILEIDETGDISTQWVVSTFVFGGDFDGLYLFEYPTLKLISHGVFWSLSSISLLLDRLS